MQRVANRLPCATSKLGGHALSSAVYTAERCLKIAMLQVVANYTGLTFQSTVGQVDLAFPSLVLERFSQPEGNHEFL